MTEAAFHGSVSSEEGPEVKTVVSFPGQYQEDWTCLVRRSVKRSAFEAEDPGQPCAHYLSGSTACVFLPKTSKLYGDHAPNDDGTSSSCWCQDLYDKQQPFGCRWFEEWRLRVETAVERKHTLVVVYKAGQRGVGREGLAWPPQIECSAARRGDAGLGVSQRGEVAWLLRNGLAFEEEDILEYRRRLAADIKLELKELQSRSPLPSLRASRRTCDLFRSAGRDGQASFRFCELSMLRICSPTSWPTWKWNWTASENLALSGVGGVRKGLLLRRAGRAASKIPAHKKLLSCRSVYFRLRAPAFAKERPRIGWASPIWMTKAPFTGRWARGKPLLKPQGSDPVRPFIHVFVQAQRALLCAG